MEAEMLVIRGESIACVCVCVCVWAGTYVHRLNCLFVCLFVGV